MTYNNVNQSHISFILSLSFCILFIFYFIIRHIYKILCAGAAFLGITLSFESDTVNIDRQTKLTD